MLRFINIHTKDKPHPGTARTTRTDVCCWQASLSAALPAVCQLWSLHCSHSRGISHQPDSSSAMGLIADTQPSHQLPHPGAGLLHAAISQDFPRQASGMGRSTPLRT